MNNKSDFKILLMHAKGFIKFFFISAVATVLKVSTSFAAPQIIRFTVDSVIGDIPLNYIKPLMGLIDIFGGIDYFKENLWICAFPALLKKI